MNKLAITMYCLPALILAACGGDAGGSTTGKTTESSPGTVDQTQSPGTGTTAATERTESRNISSNSYTGFDMAGIYLGMSPEEAEMVIEDYAPDMAIKKDLINFDYNALGTRYKTDSFITYMGGSTYGGKLSLGVRFSYPPNPLKVVGISRGDRHQDSPIPQSVYVESLIEKYGPPALDTGSSGTGERAERTIEWLIGDGTVQCLAKGVETMSGPVLDRISQGGRRYPDPTPEFTQQCISMMRYVLRGEPVIKASGSMLDVAASAKAEFEARAWIQSLIDERSKPGTEKPSL
jgi:hypothetical protein